MDTNEQLEWDESRYNYLNLYFKSKIQELLSSDPHLQHQVGQGGSLQLNEIVEAMTLNDQVAWQEFMQLDQLKMHQDLQNHLEGKGNPLNTQTGFYRTPPEQKDEENQLW